MANRRILRLMPVAAACLLFASCIDSTVPLSAPDTSVADERLLGDWRLRGDDGSVNDYRVVAAGDKLPASVMRLTGHARKPDDTTEQFEPLLFFPTTIGQTTYLNVIEGKETIVKQIEDKGWTAETVNAYRIFRYRFEGQMLVVHIMDTDAKRRFIESGKIKGVIEKNKDGFVTNICFQDTSENLARFVTEVGDSLFSKDEIRLQRVK